MLKQKHYYYDSESGKFVPLQYDSRKKLIHSLSYWLINGFVIVTFVLAILSKSAGTPSEIALKYENKALAEHLRQTEESLTELERQLHYISKMDSDMYRSVLGMEPVSEDLRKAGTGGADIYSKFDVHSQSTAELLRNTASKVDQLERQISVQILSFEEIKSFYNSNQERMRNIPAIKPVNGILLSGFGMRIHPVLRYRRMHEGIDFRADVGTEIHATGDGVVKFAGRKGTYGNLLEIDHGFGMITRYAHLSSFEDGIRPGKRVKRGELVAYSGNTGLSEGPHLHYEILVDGKPVDPLQYLIADISPEEYLLFREEEEESDFSISMADTK